VARRLTEEVKSEIKKLRSQGWSLPELRRKFGIGNGTVMRYIQGVEILPEYKDFWLQKRKSSVNRKVLAENKAYNKALKTITSLKDKERELILASLYWGEGGKGDFNLTNTDPDLIRVFVKGLTEIYNIPVSKIRLSLRLYEDLDRDKCIDYWSQITGVPKENYRSVNVLVGKKLGKLMYGMCRLRIEKGGDMLKYLKALRRRIIETF
jgi:hypothetical protein